MVGLLCDAGGGHPIGDKGGDCSIGEHVQLILLKIGAVPEETIADAFTLWVREHLAAGGGDQDPGLLRGGGTQA